MSKSIQMSHSKFIQVICPWHISHLVSPLGFLLLEEVEQALGSAKQEVEWASVVNFSDDYLISALSSRVSQQHGYDGKFEGEVLCLQRQE